MTDATSMFTPAHRTCHICPRLNLPHSAPDLAHLATPRDPRRPTAAAQPTWQAEPCLSRMMLTPSSTRAPVRAGRSIARARRPGRTALRAASPAES
eukprot:4083772-Prymnesium_polylepis.1